MDERVSDQRIADLVEHPLGLPDPGRIDLGAQWREETTEKKAHDGDDDRKLDEGEPFVTPAPAGRTVATRRRVHGLPARGLVEDRTGEARIDGDPLSAIKAVYGRHPHGLGRHRHALHAQGLVPGGPTTRT